MAKRKTKKKTHRRRVGATGLNAKSNLVRIGSVALGVLLAAKPINDGLDKVLGSKVDSKIIGAGQIGLGALLMLKGKPSLIKTVIGGVIAGAGIKREMTAFGLGNVGGYGQVPVIGNYYGKTKRMGGYGQIPVIGNNGGVGKYNPNSRVGSYAPNSMARVMGNASNGNGSGSGLMQ